jgi:predicted transcriptional regulator
MSFTDDMATLKQTRDYLGLGVRELARNACVGKDTVSRIENGLLDPEKVGYGDIVRLVRALRRAGLRKLKVEDVFPVEGA